MVKNRSYLKRVAMVALAIAGVCPAGASAQSEAGGYQVATKYTLPASRQVTGLAVDSDARRLYVGGGDGVEVVNADDGRPVRTIAMAGGAGGVVVAPEMHKGFASAPTQGKVIIFDLDTGRAVKTVSVGQTPAGLVYVPTAKRVYVADQGSKAITAIDAASGAVVGTAKLPSAPGELEANSYGSLYAAMPVTNQVAVISTGAVTYQGAIPIASGDKCPGLALDPVGRRLFVDCLNGDVAVVDTDTGFTFDNLGGAKGPSTGTFVARPDGKAGWKGAAIFAVADGHLTLVKMEAFVRYVVGGEVTLQPGLGPVAFDSKTHRLIVSASTPAGAELLVLTH